MQRNVVLKVPQRSDSALIQTLTIQLIFYADNYHCHYR